MAALAVGPEPQLPARVGGQVIGALPVPWAWESEMKGQAVVCDSDSINSSTSIRFITSSSQQLVRDGLYRRSHTETRSQVTLICSYGKYLNICFI